MKASSPCGVIICLFSCVFDKFLSKVRYLFNRLHAYLLLFQILFLVDGFVSITELFMATNLNLLYYFFLLIPLCPPFILKPVLDIYHTANNFPFMYSGKRFSQASLLISTQYLQTRITKFCLELWYSGEKYSTIDLAVLLSAQGTTYFQMELWNYSSTGDSYIQIRTAELVPWNFSFSKVYI